jgi:rhodanese-related sulfurtransferase
VQHISPEDLQALIDADAVTLIEALPEPRYDAEHLSGAVNLPGELTADLAQVLAPERSRTVVAYCSGPSCGRSKVAAAAFTRLGYSDVRVYPDGKADWVDAGLPIEGARAIPKAA